MSKTKEKKKHSTGALLMWCIITFILGAAVMCGAFYLLTEHAQVDWAEYIENTLIPSAIAIVAAIGTSCLALKPIIDKIALVVSSVIEKFKQATDDVNATVASSARSEEEVYQSRLQIAELKESVEEIKSLARDIPEALAVIRETRNSVAESCEMSRLGFGSMNELVKNGAARRISDLHAVSEGSEVSENDGSTEA